MDKASLPQRISLRDIGRLANLSHSTVSMALRNNPSIAAKTRKRIQELAASLGYVPDPMLRALAEYRRGKATRQYQGALAWIDNDPNPVALNANHEFYWYRQGAEQRAMELGYKLVTFTPAAERMTSAALRRVLLNSGIRGLLFSPQPQSHTALDFDFSGFSAVTFGFTLYAPQLHVVTNCQFRSIMIAVRQLRSRGFKKIGFVLSEMVNERSEGNFLGGFLAEQNKMADKERIPVFFSKGETSDKKKFRRWFETYRPDALVADFFEWTVIYLQEFGLRVPEDVPLAILCAVPHLRRYAGVDQNDRKIGQLAVDTLVGMLYRNETGVPEIPTRILVEGQWQDGESVPIRHEFTSVM